MAENGFDIEILDTQDVPEKEPFSGHYLDHPEIRKIISENWPDLEPLIEKITRPIIGETPDELESWEAKQRQNRISALLEQPPLYALQSLLYEECFGVRAVEVQDDKYESLAPTPGGMISHGYPIGTYNGAGFEKVVNLPFSGQTAKEAANSLTDRQQRENFIEIVAQIMQPFSFGESEILGQHYRQSIRKSLTDPKLTPKVEVDTWAYRLLSMIKSESDLNAPVKDQGLKNIISNNLKRDIPLIEFWNMLWKQMDRSFMELSGSNLVYKDPNKEPVMESIGKLLFVRTHPETQIIFKYLSPSGYLNEQES